MNYYNSPNNKRSRRKTEDLLPKVGTAAVQFTTFALIKVDDRWLRIRTRKSADSWHKRLSSVHVYRFDYFRLCYVNAKVSRDGKSEYFLSKGADLRFDFVRVILKICNFSNAWVQIMNWIFKKFDSKINKNSFLFILIHKFVYIFKFDRIWFQIIDCMSKSN